MTEKPLLYRPANGFEAMEFMERWCDRCAHQDAEDECGNEGCGILAAATLFAITDGAYPSEWRYEDGEPTCKAFEPAEKEAWRKALDEISGVRA